MAFVAADRVQETTATSGTGDLTLAGAVNGFLPFSARLAVGDATFYAVVQATQWEIGVGTLTGTTTLQRTTVLASSNGDAVVNFAAGTKQVFIDAPAILTQRLADFAFGETTASSAATTDLGAQNSRRVAITGTAAITSFGTKGSAEKLLRFTGACTLTFDATKLVLPTGASIATAAGDTALATSDGNGNWTVRHYQRADGTPLTGLRRTGVVAKSAAFAATAADQGRLFACSGTWALTLPAASSVTAGFAIEVANAGTGKITLTPNGSDTIRGAASLVVNTREAGTLVSDGANWQAIGFTPVIVATSVSDRNGYVRWSNGFTEQWGSNNGETTFSFPLAYTNAPSVVISYYGADTGGVYIETIHFSLVATTGCTTRPRSTNPPNGGVASDGNGYNWIAKGFI